MKFTAREDIDLPIEKVFAGVTDFEGFERAAMQRGAEVRRLGDHSRKGIGQSWLVHFRYRGRMRELATEVVRYDPPHRLASFGGTGGMDATFAVALTELSPERTRLTAELQLKPSTLGARLFLQSLKLAKNPLGRRFKARVQTFARRLQKGRPPR